jgi:hypothetical protein
MYRSQHYTDNGEDQHDAKRSLGLGQGPLTGQPSQLETRHDLSQENYSGGREHSEDNTSNGCTSNIYMCRDTSTHSIGRNKHCSTQDDSIQNGSNRTAHPVSRVVTTQKIQCNQRVRTRKKKRAMDISNAPTFQWSTGTEERGSAKLEDPSVAEGYGTMNFWPAFTPPAGTATPKV